MNQQQITTDVVIIGAGPVGLFAVFECGMLKFKCHVIDALDHVGGQCTALYPEKPIYDIPAYPELLASELIENLMKQIEPFQPEFHLGQSVTHCEKQGDVWQVETSKGQVIHCKAIIIAAGVGAFGPKKPPLANIEEFEGQSVFYSVLKKDKFAGKRIVIAGGGDSAVDWAMSLHDIAEKIYVIHRRDKFRAAPENVSRLKTLAEEQGKLEFVIPYQLAGLEGQNGQLEKVIVASLQGGERVLKADTLLPFFGLATELGPIAEWGLNLNQNVIQTEYASSATNRDGIYAIGDIAHYEGKLKLIMTGFAEAAQAAYAIRKQIFPDEMFHFEYSTTQGVQGV